MSNNISNDEKRNYLATIGYYKEFKTIFDLLFPTDEDLDNHPIIKRYIELRNLYLKTKEDRKKALESHGEQSSLYEALDTELNRIKDLIIGYETDNKKIIDWFQHLSRGHC